MIITNFPEMEKELSDIARLFKYDSEIKIEIIIKDGLVKDDPLSAISINRSFFGYGKIVSVIISIENAEHKFEENCSATDIKRRAKYIAKYRLYHVLKLYKHVDFVWGNLTGIRPVSLYNRILKETDFLAAELMFSSFFEVTPEKLQLIKNIYNQQKPFYTEDLKSASIYVGIPLCKGRCSYCSFFSADIDKNPHIVSSYTDSLISEINSLKSWISKENYKIRSIYIGGGTPSSLPKKELLRIIKALSEIKTDEFTVEAGRPDSIDKELIDMFVANKVTRMSINTQSSCDDTLKLIGRNHTFDQVKEAFELAKKTDLIINTDIIAGLPNETGKDFLKTLNDVLILKPQNITMHTLALKRGSILVEDSYEHNENNIDKIYNEAYSLLYKNGYNPYYMYRQKNTAGNLENTGFSIKDTVCVYNIDNMEDAVNIIACGAGSISKIIGAGGAVDRLAAPKDIKTYIAKQAEISEKKKAFFCDSIK